MLPEISDCGQTVYKENRVNSIWLAFSRHFEQSSCLYTRSTCVGRCGTSLQVPSMSQVRHVCSLMQSVGGSLGKTIE